MKVLKITNKNGWTDFLITESYGHSGKFFETSSKHIVRVKSRPFLYSLEESKAGKRLEYLEALQFDGSVGVSNLEGYASVGFVMGLLDKLGLVEGRGYVPYHLRDYSYAITYGELGYLLAYACRGEEDFPALGKYKPSDPKMKISIISVESEGQRVPEFRLGQYSSDTLFSKYLEDIRLGSRPVPLPLFYGFREYFSEEDVTLLGQVPRGKVLDFLGVDYLEDK